MTGCLYYGSADKSMAPLRLIRITGYWKTALQFLQQSVNLHLCCVLWLGGALPGSLGHWISAGVVMAGSVMTQCNGSGIGMKFQWRSFGYKSKVVVLCSVANFINAADRVLMPLAIVPMTNEYKWSLYWQGWILSAFAFGYFTSQLFAQHVPAEERSRAFGYMVAAGSVGQTFASLFVPHIDWHISFEVFGLMGIIWVVCWLLTYHDPPMLADEEGQQLLEKWLPTYLSRTLGANKESMSLTAVPYIISSLCGVVWGHVADQLISVGWPVLRVRRLMTFFGLMGPGLCLALFPEVSNLVVAVLVISMAMGLCAANSAGHLSNHADVAPNHAGITFAISNTIATIPGILCGPLTAELVVASHGRWFPVFFLAGTINFTAAMIYHTQSSARPIL
ncbi:Sodium-dependent phosphate transport protein 1, chloroplastic [Portunus trituberculatus]|uniref:Sodium-dependent phosphate transport protein 1, chloroplastic n=1 Tax=Portunus trituberculatus TaxID=210409 RepID=A0A5B7CIJ8_PORTR|nr:Sodium-dependent phosphate transport protein 1, chloroplastic [Portunus trituberculatus]